MLIHRTVGKVLVYLNCDVYNIIPFVVIFTGFLADSHLVAIFLFVCSQLSVAAGCYCYYYLHDN